MKTLKIASLALLMIAIPLVAIPVSMASGNNDRYRDDSSSVFAPGYINAAKYQAEAIVAQHTQPKGLLQNLVEFIIGKTGNKVQEGAAEKPKPVLKQKASSGGKTSKTQAATYAQAPQGSVLIAENYKVNFGTGTLQHYENGRLISEYIGGVKHVYAGFDQYGYKADGTSDPIQQAINAAQAGDVIIVSKGTYNGSITIPVNANICGGFDNDGSRDILGNKSTIVGDVDVGTEETPIAEWGRTTLNGFALSDSKVTLCGYLSTFFLINNASSSQSDWTYELSYKYMGGRMVASFADKVTTPFGWGIVGPGGPHKFVSTAIYTSAISTLNTPARPVLVEKPDTGSAATNDAYNNMSNSDRLNNYEYAQGLYGVGKRTDESYKKDAFAMILGALKDREGVLGAFQPKDLDAAKLSRALKDRLEAYALAVNPSIMKGVIGDETGVMAILAGILRNPTTDQKVMLDSVKALLNDINKVEDASDKQSPELKKASDDLLQMVANILLAQGVPDLLKSGDVSNIKSIFQELDATRAKIMLEYSTATKPYYDNIIKDLAKNIAMLQSKNLLKPDMTREELSKLSPSELDKILEKIRSMKDKSFEEEYILQQEAKYRQAYLDPNKKKLEADMKDMLNSFTGRIGDLLKAAEKK